MSNNIVLKGKVKSINEEEGTVEIIASTNRIDRDHDRIDPKGWQLDNFKKHPVLVANHDTTSDLDNIIGKIIDFNITEDSFITKVKYFINKGNKKADWAWELVKEGMGAYSVSFIPIKYKENDQGGVDYIEQELLEISQVIIPANPDAITRMKKSITPYKEYEWMPDSVKWDKARARRDARKYANGDMKKYREFFVYYDESKPDNMTSYKLPIRYLSDGKPKNVWKGIISAMAVVLGAMGGINIPEDERRKAYDYLAKLYVEHGNVPPEYKDYKNEVEILYVSGFASISEALETLTTDNTVDQEPQEDEEAKFLKQLRDILSIKNK